MSLWEWLFRRREVDQLKTEAFRSYRALMQAMTDRERLQAHLTAVELKYSDLLVQVADQQRTKT